MSTLGLGLRLEPHFSTALFKRGRSQLAPRSAKFGPAVAVIMRPQKPDRQEEVFIVLTASAKWNKEMGIDINQHVGVVLLFQYPDSELFLPQV